MKIRPMVVDDLLKASLVHKDAFVRQRHSFEWLECNLNAFPRMMSFVAEVDDPIVGYIIWNQKSGFRPEAVVELEQIAVLSLQHGQGVGRSLIEETLPLLKDQLSKQGSVLEHVTVTTRADNHAQKLYSDALGAEVEATIAKIYSADEVFMVSRNIAI